MDSANFSQWPVVFKDTIILGNPESSTAVLCLWTEKDRICSRIPGENYSACGNLYSADGINGVIRNVFANPSIRSIIICGEDLSKAGECFLKFMENGIDDDWKIVGTNAAIDKEMPKDKIDLFRNSVNAVDMRKVTDTAVIMEKLNELNKKETQPFSEPQFFKETVAKIENMPSENAGFLIRSETIAEGWLKILNLVMKYGEVKKTEQHVKQKEILNLMVVVDKEDETLASFFPFNDKDLETYCPTILTAEKPASVSYTYGQRLYKYSDNLSMDQIENAMQKLKETPHTRRAIAFTWNVEIDSKSLNPPCLTQVCWSIRGSKLHQTVHFRSHDIFGAWPMNVFALKKLHKKIASGVEVEEGPLTIVSHSAHIYENNWGRTKEILNKYYTGIPENFIFDWRGSFFIYTEDGEIVTQHFTRGREKTQYIFRGKTPEEVYYKIISEGLVSLQQHAAYLGKELEKAYLAIKHGVKYVQDKELEL